MKTQKAWHMTLTEYQEKVTPLLKKFFKFVEKYPQYFRKADYYGLFYLTPQEFLEKEMEKMIAQGYKNIANKEYIDTSWSDSYMSSSRGTRPEYDVPADILKQYKDQIEELDKIFSPFTNKVERDEVKNNKRTIRRVADGDTYVEELLDKEITPHRLQEIFDSVGLRIPKRIQQMKNKVESAGYDRSSQLLKAKKDKEFLKKVYQALGNSIQVLRDRFRSRVEGLIERWKKFEGPSYRFEDQIKDPVVNDVLRLLDKEKNKIPQFEERMKVLEDAYAESFIVEFVHNINNKLAIVNEEFGHPEIKINNIGFRSGRMEGTLSMEYPNFKLFVEVEVILAGGYNIQRLHERYLIKIFKDGKMINLEKLDKLGKLEESKFLNFSQFAQI